MKKSILLINEIINKNNVYYIVNTYLSFIGFL